MYAIIINIISITNNYYYHLLPFKNYTLFMYKIRKYYFSTINMKLDTTQFHISFLCSIKESIQLFKNRYLKTFISCIL